MRDAHYRKGKRPELTARQREVLALISRGKTNPEIADELGITLDGAKFHVSEILERLHVSTREEAAEWWRGEGGRRSWMAVLAGVFGSSAAGVTAGAALLAGAIVVGLWLANRPVSSTSTGPVALRDEVAAGAARVTFVVPRGFGAESKYVITVLPGVGWVWDQVAPAISSGPDNQVISSSGETIARVEPGCYVPVSRASLLPIPGVTLARHLKSAPHLRQVGKERWAYSVPAGSPGRTWNVVEDLSSVGKSRSYSAQLMLNQVTAGSFTVRSATQAEQERAISAIQSTHASPTTTFGIAWRNFLFAATVPGASLDVVVPRDCSSRLVVLGASASTNQFDATGGYPFYGLTVMGMYLPVLDVTGNAVFVENAVPVPAFQGSDPAIEAALQAPPTSVPFHTGSIFATLIKPSPTPGGQAAVVYDVLWCHAAPWFPCGG